jgi:hypothetical protein
MAKVVLTVQLQKDSGANIGSQISKVGPTHSAAKALIDTEIQARVDAATAAQADLVEAQNAFNS